MTPLYEHDCGRCEYLGRYEYDGDNFDLYYCAHEVGGEPTVIARWSSDGPDYTSGLCFIHVTKPLGEAYRRTVKKGLVDELTKKKAEAYENRPVYVFKGNT